MDILDGNILTIIALSLTSLRSIYDFFISNRRLSLLFSDDFFWMQRFNKDYPYLTNLYKIRNSSEGVSASYRELYQWILSVGIGDNLTTNIASNKSLFLFIRPQPPYIISDWRNLSITQIGSEPDYFIGYDIILSKTKDKGRTFWTLIHYSRDVTSISDIFHERAQQIKSINEIKDDPDQINKEISKLFIEAHLIVKNVKLSTNKYEKLSEKGFILRTIHHQSIAGYLD